MELAAGDEGGREQAEVVGGHGGEEGKGAGGGEGSDHLHGELYASVRPSGVSMGRSGGQEEDAYVPHSVGKAREVRRKMSSSAMAGVPSSIFLPTAPSADAPEREEKKAAG